MDFRRNGQLDGRRRRVLMDTSSSGGIEKDEAKPASGGGRGPVRAYAAAVLDERQPRLTDLIPKRAFVLLMLALVGLTTIASIEAVYIHLYDTLSRGTALPGIDLAQRGNVANWFSSLLLAAGSAAALVIYSIRLHRVDDYRGRYRVWLWTSTALLLGSVHVVTGLHESVNALCLHLSGMSRAGAGNFLWLGVYGIVLGGVGLWLAVELWPSLEAFGAFAATGTLCVLALVAEAGLLPLEGQLLSTVVQTSVVMLTHGTLAYSLALYARHVYLDAEGRLLVQVERAKPKKSKSSAKLSVVTSDDGAESRRKKSSTADKAARKEAVADEERTAGASISAATLKSPANAKPLAVAERDPDDDAPEEEKLSRAERRRLKKLAQQGDGHSEQRRAA